MKSPTLIVVLSIFLAGCGANRELTRLSPPPRLGVLSVASSSIVKGRIDDLLADSLFPPSNVGIKVVSLTRGVPVYALNEDMVFNPASNQKLFTSCAALTNLGPSYQFTTTVLVDTSHRRVLLKGRGDPITSTGDLDSLARLIAPRLNGPSPWQVSVDGSFFDDLVWGAGWTWDEEPAAYGMFISPITLNNNAIEVRVLPSATAGTPPQVVIEPPTSYVTLENSAVTVADSPMVRLHISRKWRERSNTITVAGQIKVGARGRTEQLSVWKPELYAGTVFAERLKAYGVEVGGAVTADSITPGMIEFQRAVHGIDTVLTFMNKVSDNLSAECMLKTTAAEKTGLPGSAENGAYIVNAMLAGCGVDTNRNSVVDGSGLSRYDLTSTATIVRLLARMYRDSLCFPLLYHALPIAGVDGTIGSRMRGTPAAGNLRAKTGSLGAVSALSGYVQTADGEMLAFSILMQSFPGATRPYRVVQDAIGTILATLKRGEY